MTADPSTLQRLTPEERVCLTSIVRKPFDVNTLQDLVNQAAGKLPTDA
jgi:hypothetical protein